MAKYLMNKCFYERKNIYVIIALFNLVPYLYIAQLKMNVNFVSIYNAIINICIAF